MKKFFIVLFLIIPITLSVVIFATPDKNVSENENRNLKTKSTIKISQFQNDLESYLSDQFVSRDLIVSTKSKFYYAIGKRDLNGAYIGKNRLIQKITDSDIDLPSLTRNANRINDLAKNIDTYVMYIPSAGIVLKDELPRNAEMYDYDGIYSILENNLSNAKMIKLDNIDYYSTDHHWTANGAYTAYLAWCDAHNIEPSKYDFRTVSTDFKGTLYSKVLIEDIGNDTIEAPIIKNEIVVTADGKEIELYDESALETKDKYNYFEGGNHGVLVIENKSVNNGKCLLIIKDSFANSFVPYLINDYEKIVMLDERYTFVTPEEIIESEKITELAIIKEIIG